MSKDFYIEAAKAACNTRRSVACDAAYELVFPQTRSDVRMALRADAAEWLHLVTVTAINREVADWLLPDL